MNFKITKTTDKTIYTIPQEVNYLSELDGFQLPKGVFNKKTTGCGGTTIALESSDNYVIAVPLVELIDNKVAQHEEVIGVHANLNSRYSEFKEAVENTLADGNPVKVMTTYDSFRKVMDYLTRIGIEAHKECKVLIDEYHMILTEYGYRDNAIRNMLKEVVKCDYYTFMTATPFDSTIKFLDDVEMEYTECYWVGATKINVDMNMGGSGDKLGPAARLNTVLRSFKLNGYAYNNTNLAPVPAKELFIFMNSVEGIRKAIENANLTPSEVSIICSDTSKNRRKLDLIEVNGYEGYDYTIDKVSINGVNKPITFVTSKAYVGVDFYSDCGLSIVVTEASKNHTLLDVSTHITQIAGRLRSIDNPFKACILHIADAKGKYAETKDDFNERVAKDKEFAESVVYDCKNTWTDIQKRSYVKLLRTADESALFYFDVDKDEFVYDALKKTALEFHWFNANEVYKKGVLVRDAYTKQGFNIANYTSWDKSGTDVRNAINSFRWRDVMEAYYNAYINNNTEALDNFSNEEHIEFGGWIEKFDAIGELEAIKANSYQKKRMNAYYCVRTPDYRNLVTEYLLKTAKLEDGGFYNTKELKTTIQKAYDSIADVIGAKRKAKATDITEYMDAEAIRKRVDGKVTRGFEVRIKKVKSVNPLSLFKA